MTHLYSRGVEYALRCLRLMAKNPDHPRTIQSLCEEAQLPEHFTRKMVQPLVKAGLLESLRGPGGGFVFTIPPKDISLRTVVEEIERGPRKNYCILGQSECVSDNPCALHDQWIKICELTDQLLDRTTVLDLTLGWDGSKEGPILLQNEATETPKQGTRDPDGRRYLPRL